MRSELSVAVSQLLINLHFSLVLLSVLTEALQLVELVNGSLDLPYVEEEICERFLHHIIDSLSFLDSAKARAELLYLIAQLLQLFF